MTEQKKYEVLAPPHATNYKINMEVQQDGNQWMGDVKSSGSMTCTACGAAITESLGVWALDGSHAAWIQDKVTRHNRDHHRDLLYVWTSAGWMVAGKLIPDPVRMINEVIAKDASKFLHN